jgi:hypothetical protein
VPIGLRLRDLSHVTTLASGGPSEAVDRPEPWPMRFQLANVGVTTVALGCRRRLPRRSAARRGGGLSRGRVCLPHPEYTPAFHDAETG